MTDQSDEMIDATVAFHLSKGRRLDCALIVWLQAQRGRSAQAVRHELVQHPDWTGSNSLEGIIAAGRLATGERQAAQAIYATHLTTHGSDKHKRLAMAFLAGRRGLVAPPVLTPIENWARS
jgi:hypothetical protein